MKKFNIKPRDAVKFVASSVACAGTSVVVKQLIKQNVVPDNTYVKVGVAVGTVVLAAMVKDHTDKFISAKVDAVADAITTAKAATQTVIIVDPEEV